MKIKIKIYKKKNLRNKKNQRLCKSFSKEKKFKQVKNDKNL